MSGFRRICVAGASGSDNGFSTGQFIARAILQKKQQGQVDDVLIIGRKGSVESDPKKQKTIKEFEAMGGRYVGVDYGNVDELANVLKGCDCVVSAVSVQDATAIKSGEIALAYAAAQAGVKRFIPSQFGPDDEMLPVKLRENEVYFRKKAVLDLVKELGMEWTVVITGFYMNCLFSEFICGWSDKGGQIKANVVGDGSPWVMGSAREDIGSYVAAMVTSNPALSRNKIIRIISDAWHPGDEIKHFEDLTGKKVTVERHPAKVRPRQGLLYPRLFSDGIFTVNPSLWDNEKWPEVKPFTLKAYVAKEFAQVSKM